MMSLQVNDQEIDWEKWQFLEINDETKFRDNF